MATPHRFAKMHGLGNDFIVLDGVSRPPPPLTAASVRALADRHRGIGFDQLLLLEKPADADSDFFYRIYNADGGEVGQCGNGVRCAHAFLLRRALTDKQELRLATITTTITTRIIAGGRVRAQMPPPQFFPPQHAGGHRFEHLAVGNPHYVCLSGGGISDAELNALGQTLNNDIAGGVNVGAAELRGDGIHLRVYERGAGRTAACGSGALAAAAAAIRAGKTANPTNVTMPGGALRCGVEQDGGVWMEGDITHVFDGDLPPPPAPQ